MKLDSPLISTTDLAEHLDDPKLRIFDTTIRLVQNPDGFGYVPESGRADWETSHIPGAEFIDVIAELSDKNQALPAMMLPAEEFAAIMAARGVSDDSFVVLYNSDIPMWSTRLWWMLKSIGFDNVAILNGGFEKWVREGLPVSSDHSAYAAGSLSVSARQEAWADKSDMLQMIDAGNPVTINALSPEVYSGEINQYGRPGHIPGTYNVFFGTLINPETGEFHSPEVLREYFRESAALDSERVVTYCGGGITATMVCLALALCGQNNAAVYDGSMSEWVADEALPLKLGSDP